ncbi:MAG: CPBP family intramembrane metalloprotease [Bacillota bacterium]|nr:CPBP family intramembrane metalloprotease [Bacillota bacterium]
MNSVSKFGNFLRVIVSFLFIAAVVSISTFLAWQRGFDSETYILTTGSFLGCCAFLIVPRIRIIFKERFLVSDIRSVLLFTLIIVSLGSLLTYLFRYSPILFGHNPFEIGSGQFDKSFSLFSLEAIFYTGLLPGISEEITFRLAAYALFDWLVSIQKPYLKKPLLFLCVVISSTIFALFHGTDGINFFLYFVPSVVFWILFWKFGFFSCVLGHAWYNILSGSTDQIAIGIIKLLIH